MKTQLSTFVLGLISFLLVFSCDPPIPPEPPIHSICPPTSAADCSPRKKIRKTDQGDEVTFELIIELQPAITSFEVLKDSFDSFQAELADSFLLVHPDSILLIKGPSRWCNCNLMLLDVTVSRSTWVDINNGPAGAMSPPGEQNEGEYIVSAGLNYDIDIGPTNPPYDTMAVNPEDTVCIVYGRDSLKLALALLTTSPNCTGVLLGDESGDQSDLTVVAGIDTGSDPRYRYSPRTSDGEGIVSTESFYLSKEVNNIGDEILVSNRGAGFALNDSDDDPNCNIDDLWGVDFFHEDNYPLDRKGHGTHIAGTILSARERSNSGIKFMTLQIGGYEVEKESHENFRCDLFSIICAVNYAVENDADIINMSLGYYSEYYHVPFYRQLQKAQDAGVLVVTSLGNDTTNVDDCAHWPSNFSRIFPENVIAVAALGPFERDDEQFELAHFSNYGQHADLAAPGWMIESAMTGTIDGTVRLSGTSMAAAIVSRRAAMIRDSVLLSGETITAAQIKAQILQEAEVHSNICVQDGKVLTHRSDTSLLRAIGY